MFKLKLLVKLTECPLSETPVTGRRLQKTLLLDNSCCSPPTSSLSHHQGSPNKNVSSKMLLDRLDNRELFKMDTSMNEARKALQKPAWTVALAKAKESSILVERVGHVIPCTEE